MNELITKVVLKVGANSLTPQLPDSLKNAPTDPASLAKNVTNLLLYIVGIVAVIMVIVGGFLYITSSGDPGRTKSAKDTIVYAVIGIVVALLAYAIVNFVIVHIK